MKSRIIAFALGTLVGIFASAGIAQAQGTRKDDIVLNARGVPAAGASVAVCTQPAVTTTTPCSPLALIYSNAQLTQALANPLATDGLGNYTFYAAPGKYTVQIYGPSITTKVIPDVVLPNDPASPTFTSVTTSSGITAFTLTLSGNLVVGGSASVTLGLSAATMTLANQSSAPGSPAAGNVIVYSKTADKKLYYKDDSGAESGPLVPGGAGVTADNTWTAPQRFKGPVPWRDVTAYGAFSSTVPTIVRTTGNMSASSNQLTSMGSAMDFANGQSIAVIGAGPLSTLAAPTGLSVTPRGPQSSGTTTYSYQVVAVDAKGGFGPAGALVSTTVGPAALSPDNYIDLKWNHVTGAVGYMIYGRASGSMACVGTSFQFQINGSSFGYYQDYGLAFPCLAFAPAAPPGSAGAQPLLTSITSGGGTTTLTLAATATTAVTGQFVYHDEWPAIKAAIAAANADTIATGGAYNNTGSPVVYIPPGQYFVSNPIMSDALGGLNANGEIRIMVAGTLYLYNLPIIIDRTKFSWEGGLLGGGGINGAFSRIPTTFINMLNPFPALFVLSANGFTHVKGFGSGPNVRGHGIIVSGPAANSVKIEQIDFTHAANSGGACLLLEANLIDADFSDFYCNAASTTGKLASVLFNFSENAGSGGFVFEHGFFSGHTVKVQGSQGGSIAGVTWRKVLVESNLDNGFVTFDGANAGISDWTFDQVSLSDSLTTPNFYVYQTAFTNSPTFLRFWRSNSAQGYWGSNLGQNYTGVLNMPQGMFIEDSGTPGGSAQQNVGSDTQYFRFGSQFEAGYPIISVPPPSGAVGQPNETSFGQLLQRPFQSAPVDAGAGSLAAGTYFYEVVGMDEANGQTIPSQEKSITVAANHAVTVNWTVNFNQNRYFKFRIYRGTAAGGENTFYETSSCCSFTDTGAAGTNGSPQNYSNAFATKLSWGDAKPYWIAAGASGDPGHFVGIGTAAPGTKLDVNGVVTARSGLILGGGTQLNKAQIMSAAITPTSVAANTCAEQTFNPAAFAGLATADTVFVNSTAALTAMAFPVNYRVSAAGTLAISYCNPTGGAVTPTASTVSVLAWH